MLSSDRVDTKSNEKAMRLFVAIPVPASVCNRIAAVQMELETEFPNVRWNLAKLESFHITVRFLGDVDVACVDNLVKRLRDAASTVERFDLSACGMGCFPITNFPRVIWV
ncbi:MAG: RNA 2',3'-cyclic phosphodiesterase, partial [Planctomycetes bacterium]|nr:RNA 2',3'-cyclic phosphodiesterase [Planctomycetota bacterium]